MYPRSTADLRRGAGRPALQPDLRRHRGRSGRHRVHHGRPAVEPEQRRPGAGPGHAERPAGPRLRAVAGATTGGQLRLTATKHHVPQARRSAGTNSQLNALGVGVTGRGQRLRGRDDRWSHRRSPAAAPDSTSSQQGGVWFGLGEDDYVKAAVVRVTVDDQQGAAGEGGRRPRDAGDDVRAELGAVPRRAGRAPRPAGGGHSAATVAPCRCSTPSTVGLSPSSPTPPTP